MGSFKTTTRKNCSVLFNKKKFTSIFGWMIFLGKMHSAKNYRILSVSLCSLLFLLCLASCQKDFEETYEDISSRSMSMALLEVSYDMYTTTLFLKDEKVEYPSIDVAAMAPDRIAQRVTKRIMERGDVYMEIERIDDKYYYDVEHNTPKGKSEEIYKTVLWNGQATFFDKTGKNVASVPFRVPSQRLIVEALNNAKGDYSPEMLNYIIANMQGNFFTKNLEQFLAEAKKQGMIISEKENGHVIVRMPSNFINNKIESVIIINRKTNQLVASRAYKADEVLTTTYYAYGPPEKPFLNTIVQLDKKILPTGEEVEYEIQTKIENLNIKLNM